MQQFRNVPLAIERAEKAQVEAEILALLQERPGMHGRHIWQAIGNGRSLTFFTRAIERLLSREAIERRGNGTRNNLYRYYLKD
ncbi:hypothetical protein [Coleofasciculus sp. FACHB-T130]|uniref:hypothetical protein n=1 Tax=Cyanophyceae TaxID=3028117 RepID=UPI001682B46A|nr:hypothetical protein [Coleofasciculus sp. FACHB-T130]MBD1878370.1 hypothetical protein [Coleofasciculus sp. FACHB-T130]